MSIYQGRIMKKTTNFTFHFMFDWDFNKEVIIFENIEDEDEDKWDILELIVEDNNIPIYRLDESCYELDEDKEDKEKIIEHLLNIGFKIK